MIVYVPTPITSVEQAEALPVGTVIQCTAGPLESVPPYRKVTTGLWFGGSGPMSSDGLYLDAPAGARCEWEALLPVEAHTQDHAPSLGWGERERRHRHVTAWLPGPFLDRRGDCT